MVSKSLTFRPTKPNADLLSAARAKTQRTFSSLVNEAINIHLSQIHGGKQSRSKKI